MPRGLRLDAPDALHHVIARGIERRALFAHDADRHDFLDRLERVVVPTQTGLFAWCLMPNHFHLLVRTCSPPKGGAPPICSRPESVRMQRGRPGRCVTGLLSSARFTSRPQPFWFLTTAASFRTRNTRNYVPREVAVEHDAAVLQLIRSAP